MIKKAIKVLMKKIQDTPYERLEKLKDSIAISDMHPILKTACFEDIDKKLFRSDIIEGAVAVGAEFKQGDL